MTFEGGSKRQQFYESLQDLTDATHALTDRRVDAYFALASFGDLNNRTADNAVALKSFFLDLDCGEGKPYPDKADAVVALKQFCTETGLPRPVLVDSGGGLHAYWPLTEALDREVWLRYARRLKLLCVSRQLHIDKSVTADAARILRVPGTFNFKQSEPRAVVLLKPAMAYELERLAQCLPPEPVDLTAARMFGSDTVTQSLVNAAPHKPSKFKVILMRSASEGQGCAQMRHAYEQQATLEEPLWRAALSIAVNCTDGRKAIHRISEQHPEYNAADTEDKAQRLVGKPYTCQWYRDNNPSLCQGCKLTVTSPIQLGVTVEESTTEEDGSIRIVAKALAADGADLGENQSTEILIPPLPFPYFRGANGGIYRKERPTEDDPSPEPTLICERDLYLTDRYYNYTEEGEGDGEIYAANLHLPQDGLRQFPIRTYDVASPDRLRDVLSRHGVMAIGKQVYNIMSYFAAAIKAIQDRNVAGKTRDQFGWTPEGTFVLGGVEYLGNNKVRLAPPSLGLKALTRSIRQAGTYDAWRRMLTHYTAGGMELHAFAFLVGLGSPLLQLMDNPQVRGAVLNLMSPESGTGKTTVLMMINSIWGHPSDLLMGQKDTTMAKFHTLGMLRNLPMTVDEVTNASPEDLSNIVYGATTGRASHRMEAQTNKLRANNTTWCSFTITSSNASVSQAIISKKAAVEGELKRVIDLPINLPASMAKEESDLLFADLGMNYGFLGPRFLQYVVTNRQAVAESLKSAQRKIDRNMKFQQSDRFYSAVMACAAVAATILRDLQVVEMPVGRILRLAGAAIRGVVDNNTSLLQGSGANKDSALEVLGQFINAHQDHMLVINDHQNHEMVPPAPIREPRGAILMRYEPNTRTLYIDAVTMRAYATERRIDIRVLCHRLQELGVLQTYAGRSAFTKKKMLAKGMNGNMVTPPVNVYAISVDRVPDLVDGMPTDEQPVSLNAAA